MAFRRLRPGYVRAGAAEDSICAGLWFCARYGADGDRERYQSYKMLLTYLFYIDLLRYSHRESTRRHPANPTNTYKALPMGTICPFVGPATDKQGA
jgi:hypothetical protein